MVKLSNIVVATRVKEGNVVSALPAARSRVEGSPGEPGTLNVINDNATTTFQFDACFDAASTTESDLILERLQVRHTLHNLFAGISVGIVGLGMDGEAPGAFSNLMSTVLRELSALAQELSNLKVSISFTLLGVTDSSCIDLVSYARKELADIERLRAEPMSPLGPCNSMDEIISSLSAGYSLPCILMVRIFSKPGIELPGSISTLLLADLGSTAVGSPLEKSFAQLRSIISNQQEQGSSQDETTHCYLTSILDEFIGGSAITLVLADIPKTSVTRPLLHHLAMLDGMRRIKNRPVPNLETPEMLELAALVETHGRLEVEHRSVRRELKHLQRALRLAEQQHDELLASRETMGANNDILRWEYEYELSRLGMEKLAVHEKIRQCEIDLVCMEHERLVLIAQMELKQASLTELEERLQSSLGERAALEQRYSQEIDGLASQLGHAQEQLQRTEGEKRTLEGNLQAASGRINGLETKIKEITAQMDIRHAEGLKVQTAELKRLTGELNVARESEMVLRRQLDDLQKATTNHQDTVHSLESKLSELKVENATLLAKIEVLSKKPQSPEISRTLRVMEEKWQVEREAMRSVMEDLRKIISDRDHNNSSQTSVASLPSSQPSQAMRAQVVPGMGKGDATTSNRRGRRQRQTQNKVEEEPRASNSPGDERHVPRAAVTSHTAAISKDEAETNLGPAVTKVASSSKQSIKLPPKQVLGKTLTKTDGSNGVEKIFAAEGETNKKSNSSQPTPPADEEAVEIPGTPQKKAATQPAATSPIKVWKPSAFIPGVSRKQAITTSTTTAAGTGRNPKENVSSSLFANFNFSNRPANGEGLAKRIKLPERANRPATTELGEVSTRRSAPGGSNVDPAVFSTILGSFNIPTNLGHGK